MKSHHLSLLGGSSRTERSTRGLLGVSYWCDCLFAAASYCEADFVLALLVIWAG